MRRRLFFWLDKLKITRTERQAISVLLIIFVALLLLNTVISPSSPFDEEYYSELDACFRMRTALLQQEDQQIMSRYRGEPAGIASADTLAPDSTGGKTFADIPESALININTADAPALQQLRGIGEAYARHIIEYRQQNGSFQSINDLLHVKGIGEVRLRKIKPFITLGGENEIEVQVEEKVVAETGTKFTDDELQDEIEAGNTSRPKEINLDENGSESRIGVEDKAIINQAKSNTETKTNNKREAKGESNAMRNTTYEVKVREGKDSERRPKRKLIINVNKADAEALQKLSGIGPTYARRIVEYRQKNGDFVIKNDLIHIKGIGEKRLAKIKPFIKLTDQH